MEQIPTSQLIYQYLVKHPSVTPRQISQALHITVTDVRYHLQKLTQNGQVVCSGTIPQIGAGRPALTYQAIQKTPTETYFLLLQSIFASAATDPEFHTKVANHLIPPEKTSASIPAIRISKTIQFLSNLGYQARWESRPENPLVAFKACPYQSASSNREDFCALDCAILTVGTGYACEPISIQTKDNKGCLFELRNRTN